MRIQYGLLLILMLTSFDSYASENYVDYNYLLINNRFGPYEADPVSYQLRYGVKVKRHFGLKENYGGNEYDDRYIDSFRVKVKEMSGFSLVGYIWSSQKGGLILIIGGIILISIFVENYLGYQRRSFITHYAFPETLDAKILESYPQLSPADLKTVKSGLRKFFLVCTEKGGYSIAMPSRIVDVAWHEFILFTKDYHAFSENGFRKYLHHSPFTSITSPQEITDSLKRAWYYACKNENIDPKNPKYIPLIFHIDSILNIPDGNIFSMNLVDSINEMKNDTVDIYINVDALFNCASDAGGCDGGCGGCGGCGG